MRTVIIDVAQLLAVLLDPAALVLLVPPIPPTSPTPASPVSWSSPRVRAHPGGVVTMPTVWWALSPCDFQAHAVVDSAVEEAGGDTMVTRCGHELPRDAGLDDGPRAQVCAGCLLMVAPTFEQRGAVLNHARDAEGLGEWFSDE